MVDLVLRLEYSPITVSVRKKTPKIILLTLDVGHLVQPGVTSINNPSVTVSRPPEIDPALPQRQAEGRAPLESRAQSVTSQPK